MKNKKIFTGTMASLRCFVIIKKSLLSLISQTSSKQRFNFKQGHMFKFINELKFKLRPKLKRILSIKNILLCSVLSTVSAGANAYSYTYNPDNLWQRILQQPHPIWLASCIVLLLIIYGAIIAVSCYYRRRGASGKKPFHKSIESELLWLSIPGIITIALIVLSVYK